MGGTLLWEGHCYSVMALSVTMCNEFDYNSVHAGR